MSRSVSWPMKSVICSGPKQRDKGAERGLDQRVQLDRIYGSDVHEMQHLAQHRKPDPVPQAPKDLLAHVRGSQPTSSQKRIVVETVAPLVFSPATTSTKMISRVCTGWTTTARSGWAIPAASRVIGKLDVELHTSASAPIAASMS